MSRLDRRIRATHARKASDMMIMTGVHITSLAGGGPAQALRQPTYYTTI